MAKKGNCRKYGRNKFKCEQYRRLNDGGTGRKVSHGSVKNTPLRRLLAVQESLGVKTDKLSKNLLPWGHALEIDRGMTLPTRIFCEYTGVSLRLMGEYNTPPSAVVVDSTSVEIERIPKKVVPS